MSKKRTITLFDRPPVSIVEDDWPIIASANDDWFDGEFEFQANRTKKWRLFVRMHQDGRSIVYGAFNYSTHWQGERTVQEKGGVLVGPDDDVSAAIQDVGQRLCDSVHQFNDQDEWRRLVAECIADLPAEELT